MSASRNEHTLAPIFSNARSGEAQRNYDEGYDRIFRKREPDIDTPPDPGHDGASERESPS